jgi:TonB family protein
MRRIILICCAACSLSAAAASGETRPPRALGGPSNAVDNCYRLHAQTGEASGEAEVAVSVDAEGRVVGAASASGTPEALAAAAQCVAATMRFAPALQDGIAVAGKTTVRIGFPTPPQLRQDLRRAIEYCQPAIAPLSAASSAFEGELDLVVRVGTDGRVAETRLPDGVLPWMQEAARCLADRLEFFPARLHLKPVESWTTVPIDFNLTRNPHERVRLDPPTMRSEAGEILGAYRKCYPAGRNDEVKINYRIIVTDGGRVRKAEVVRSSGDLALDEAGLCILRELVFVPARRNGVNVEATLTWPILVRPPS